MTHLIVTLTQVGVVFAILFGFAWAMKRYGNKTGRRGVITLVSRTPLGRSSAVAVLSVAGKSYLVGVTDSHVSLLSELDLAAVNAAESELAAAEAALGGTPAPAGFAAALATARTRQDGAPAPAPTNVVSALVHVARQLRERAGTRRALRADQAGPLAGTPVPGEDTDTDIDAPVAGDATNVVSLHGPAEPVTDTEADVDARPVPAVPAFSAGGRS